MISARVSSLLRFRWPTHKAALVVWLLLTPPNPMHTRCIAFAQRLPGTDIDVAEHIAFGTFQNWQLWGDPYSDRSACIKGLADLRKELKSMPQALGSENYVCFSKVLAQATCVSSEDPRLRTK